MNLRTALSTIAPLTAAPLANTIDAFSGPSSPLLFTAALTLLNQIQSRPPSIDPPRMNASDALHYLTLYTRPGHDTTFASHSTDVLTSLLNANLAIIREVSRLLTARGVL